MSMPMGKIARDSKNRLQYCRLEAEAPGYFQMLLHLNYPCTFKHKYHTQEKKEGGFGHNSMTSAEAVFLSICREVFLIHTKSIQLQSPTITMK